MKKIAYNACYGGFGISDKAVKWLIENESDNLKKPDSFKFFNNCINLIKFTYKQ